MQTILLLLLVLLVSFSISLAMWGSIFKKLLNTINSRLSVVPNNIVEVNYSSSRVINKKKYGKTKAQDFLCDGSYAWEVCGKWPWVASSV